MRYAINVCDMIHRELKTPVQFMVAPVAQGRQTARVKKSEIDTDALILECPEPQALAICEFMQKAGKDLGRLVRCYQEGPRGGWKELARNKKEKRP